MKRRRHARLPLLLAVLLAGCGGDESYDTEAMLTSLVDEVILPGYSDFEGRTAELESAAGDFCADRTEPNLLALQVAWGAARAPWKRGEAHAIGPVYEYPWRIGPVVDAAVRTDNVDAVLAGIETLDEAYLATLGASHQGMHAVEYLVFDPAGDVAGALALFTDAGAGDRRCAYLLALAGALHAHASELVGVWEPGGEDFRAAVVDAEAVGAPYATAHEAATDLLNRLVTTVEGVYEVRLGDPAGRVSGVADPALVESPFSHRSLVDARDAIAGAERLYRGSEATEDSLGFASWLRAEDPAVADRTDAAFAAALGALDAIGGPLSDAVVTQAAEVSAAIAAIAALSDTLSGEVADTLHVPIQPSLDGD